MTNFIEQQQKKWWVRPDGTPLLDKDKIVLAKGDINAIVAQTTTNTLNHILESGLLEQKEEHQDWCKLTGELEYSSCGCWKDHNTLARDIKEFISNMDKK